MTLYNHNEEKCITHQDTDIRRRVIVETVHEVTQRLIQNVIRRAERPCGYDDTQAVCTINR